MLSLLIRLLVFLTNKFEKKLVNEKKYIYGSLLASKVENGLQTNIGLNLNSKSVHKDFYENGRFVYIEISNEIMKNQTRFLHNPDLTILEKFLNEVNWDGEWESLMEEYDKVYPQKHKTNKPIIKLSTPILFMELNFLAFFPFIDNYRNLN